MSDEQLLQFPCDFPIKVMGRPDDGFAAHVVELIRRHAPTIDEGSVQVRASKGGNYISVTVTLRAESRAQLDAIYGEIKGSPRVVMAL